MIAVSLRCGCCFKLQFALWFGAKCEHVLLLQSPRGLSPDLDMEAHVGKGRGLRTGGLDSCWGFATKWLRGPCKPLGSLGPHLLAGVSTLVWLSHAIST